jgi:hypothetical protein
MRLTIGNAPTLCEHRLPDRPRATGAAGGWTNDFDGLERLRDDDSRECFLFDMTVLLDRDGENARRGGS